ncbi:MAG: leucine-rich repeat protein, partial [Muribaculaceae bacterium]|nr:leucine-rich repeat protein [Muribaculaceae bacterium]
VIESFFSRSLLIRDYAPYSGSRAFSGCSGFSGALNIGDSVTSIGNQAFQSCSGLDGTLTIGNSVTSIGFEAFERCGFTGSLTIGDSVKYIGEGAFKVCSGFNGSLTIGDSVTSIEVSTFEDCSGFTGSLTIGNNVTSIDNRAFVGCSGFNGTLTIGESVTSIGDYAFSGCSGFTGSLNIGDKVTSIGNSAFEGCSGFDGSLTIGNSVTLIYLATFKGCSNITSLWIESTNLTIRPNAFEMEGLKNITCYSVTPPKCYDGTTFANYSAQLYVPQDAIAEYKTATEWEKFTNINPIPVPATSISLNKSELNMIVGESETLIASLLPENTTETAEWSVLAEPQGCVTVEDGKVTAVAPGSATVTATAGEFSASCKVTVTQPASEIVIDFAESGIEGDNLTLNAGESKTIAVVITPANSTDKLTWSSSNTEIATVDAEGKITAVKAGEATITVSTESGKSASLKVTVLQPASDIAIDFEGDNLTINVGETQTLKVTVTPADSTDKLTWSSSNSEIATVDSEGKITAVKAGEATITVTTESGKSASLKVTVLQ